MFFVALFTRQYERQNDRILKEELPRLVQFSSVAQSCLTLCDPKDGGVWDYQMFIDRGVNKEDTVHLYSGIFLSHLKEQNNVICTRMDGPRQCHTE